MSDRAMTMVFCYDVSENRTRRRVARMLEDWAVRVQHSVFEARMGQSAAETLFNAVSGQLDPGDSLRMYALSRAGLERCRTAGGAPAPEDGEYWLL